MTDNVREHFEQILARYQALDSKLESLGGIGQLLGFFEGVKRDLKAVSSEELERISAEIKTVVESLLKVDYELRKVQNLKLLFEQTDPSSGRGEGGKGQ